MNRYGNGITVLSCLPPYIAAKTHTISCGVPVTKAFNAGKWFNYRAFEVDGVRALHDLLVELGDHSTDFIIRGHLNQQAIARANGTVRRAKNAQKELGEVVPYFLEVPRNWVMLDFDKVPNLQGLEPTSLEAMLYLRTLLPPEFQDVVCSYSMSSSAGLSGDGATISGHLWFWIDRPVGEGELKSWLTIAPVDKALFRTVQPHFVANPIFKNGRVDPVSRRKGIVPGASDTVSVPVIHRVQPRQLTASNGTGVGLQVASGYESRISLLGDGPGLEGCHNVLTSAIAAYLNDRGPGVDFKALKHDIRNRVSEAPWDHEKHPRSYLEHETSDTVLDRSIADWINKAFVIAEPYPVDEKLSREEASAALKFEVQRWAKLAINYNRLRAAFTEGSSGLNAWFLSCAFEEYFLPPRQLIDAEVGLGKTREYIEILHRLVDALQDRHGVLISVPTHALADELSHRIAATGAEAQVYRGPRQPDPSSPAHQMCRRHTDYAVFQAAGMQSQLCKVCEHRTLCGYQRQRKLKSKIWIAPHNVLFHKRQAPIPPIDFLIVDEDPMGAGFEERSAVLTEADASPEFARAMRSLPLGVAFSRSDLDVDDHALRRLEKELWSRTNKIKLCEGADVSELYEAKIVALKIAKEATHANLLRSIRQHGVVGLRCFVDESGRRLEFTRQRRIHKDFSAALLQVDATSNWERSRHLYDGYQAPPMYEPGKFADEDGSVAIDYPYPLPPISAPARRIRSVIPHTQIRQVVFSAAKRRFLEGSEPTGNLLKLRRYIDARSASYDKVLVIGQKSVANCIRDCGLPAHVEAAHFNAIRGRDEWRDVDLLIVVGRTQPPVGAVEIHAEALFAQPVGTIQPEYYNSVWQPLTGTNYLVRSERHPDHLADMLRFHVCEEELIQAIGRGRAVNRTKEDPLQIDIINQVPLPNTKIDEVITWECARPTARDLILGRYGLLLPRKRVQGWAGIVQALLPDVFKSEKAARQAGTSSLADRPNKELLLEGNGNERSSFECQTEIVGLQSVGARYMVPAIVVKSLLMNVDEAGQLLLSRASSENMVQYLPTSVAVSTKLTRAWREKLRASDELALMW
ncbi:DEAD/DEAH box helicase family protein [Marivivens marinus]|uniref:DEAD/DEAH box helicase family protein n=1 Tax=Marivivens marinus TaxID=3110173 RepID=UPI003B848FFC